MPKAVMIFLVLALFGLAADEAAARLVKVSWVSEGELKTKCADNGGTWSSGESGYSCGKRCAGNDYCVYGCSKGKENNECHASIPRLQPEQGSRLGGALAVDNVLNWSGPSGTGSKAGAAAGRLKVGPRQ